MKNRQQLEAEVVRLMDEREAVLSSMADLLESKRIHEQSLLAFDLRDPRLAQLQARESRLYARLEQSQRWRSRQYIEYQLAIEQQAEKRQALQQLEQKISQLRKIKQEKEFHVANYYKAREEGEGSDLANEIVALNKEYHAFEQENAAEAELLLAHNRITEEVDSLLGSGESLACILGKLKSTPKPSRFRPVQHCTAAEVFARTGKGQPESRKQPRQEQVSLVKFDILLAKCKLSSLIAKQATIHFENLRKQSIAQLELLQRRNSFLLQQINALGIQCGVYLALSLRACDREEKGKRAKSRTKAVKYDQKADMTLKQSQYLTRRMVVELAKTDWLLNIKCKLKKRPCRSLSQPRLLPGRGSTEKMSLRQEEESLSAIESEEEGQDRKDDASLALFQQLMSEF